MKSIRFREIFIAIVVVFVMSKAKYICQWLRDIHDNEILTLEPIQDFPDGARVAITVAFYLLIFGIIWKLLLRK
ncbi:MAG: hypothetical protein K9M75_05165 [Phycisphaerae bacterium]|nr:hypothetical protein [Phycisphaerae bacterium]